MKQILRDTIPVVIGIMLVLILNNWQQLQSERKYVKNSIRAIISENENNISELEHALKINAIKRITKLFFFISISLIFC